MIDSTYDPLEFIGKIELITIALVGSFVTLKFLSAIYDNLYEPAMETLMDFEKTDKYYMKFGKYYVQISLVVKEFIKWFLLIMVLMIVYNLLRK